MKIGSLFSGIGGLELGLERAGVGHTVWQVEKDEFCRRVLAKHWPDVTRYEDVTTVDWSNVERADVLCGGFPCQDISPAGRGAGLEGEHSGLWAHFAEAIRVVRPRYVVVENSTSLLVRGMGTVLADLASSGLDAEWDCVPAAAVGAPHLRARLFILAHPRRVGDEADDALQAGWDVPQLRPGWQAAPDVPRVDDGPPYVVDSADRMHALGNAVVPQVSEVVGRRLLELERAA
jgi:DNA (cytosine-5)-methyltransferase 1